MGRRLILGSVASFVVLILLVVVGIPVPIGLFRSQIEARASSALASEVRIGDLALVVGIRPRVEIADLEVAHSLPGRPEVLRVEQARLELKLLPLIQRRLHVTLLAIHGARARLDPEALPEPKPKPEPETETTGTFDPSRWSLDVDEVSISDFHFELHRPDLEPIQSSLETLQGAVRWDESLQLSLAGRYSDFVVSGQIEGASLAALLAGAETWPLRLQVDLAGIPIEFAAQLATAREIYRIDDIQGHAGTTPVSGWLALENLATKPRASGRIEVGAVELTLPEAPEAPGPAQPSALSASSLSEEDAGAPLELFVAMLRDFETDLEVDVERIAGVGPAVEGLSVALRVSDGQLRFPVRLSVDEIPMSGTLSVGSVEQRPQLRFALAAESFRVDRLAARLMPKAQIQGPFEELRLALEVRGSSLLEFLESLQVDLRMRDAALTYGRERPVGFGVETLALTLAEGRPLRLSMQGDLIGEAVDLQLEAGTVETFLADRPWPLQLTARGAGATIELSGKATGHIATLDLLGDLKIHGEQLSSLEPWLGALPVPDAPYTIRAAIDDRPDETRIELEEVSLGQSRLVGEIGERRGDQGSLIFAKLGIETLDLSPYLESTRRSPTADGPGPDDEASQDRAIAFDAPILPGGLTIGDADFDFAIERLIAGRLELSDLSFRGAFREGFLPESSFGFRLGAAAFAGTAALDLRASPHSATLMFGSRDVDIGRLLGRLRVAKGVDASAGGLRLEIRGQGATLDDVLRKSDVMARLEDLRWKLRDPNSQADIELFLQSGEISSASGDEPIRLLAEGTVKQMPVRLSMETKHLSFFEQPKDRVPLDLRAEMAGATLEISSFVSLPIERSQLDLSLTLEGKSLAAASPLLDYELPAIGPYRLATRMRLTPQDYRFSDLDLRVGQSQLRGSGRLDTRGRRPRIEVDLVSDRVQLDDFAAAFESGAPDDEEAASKSSTLTETSTATRERIEQARAFWSPAGLLGFDGRLDARVRDVLSGKDHLGQGELVVSLEEGRLTLDPLHLELEGGEFLLQTEYAYVAQGSEEHVEARIRAKTEQFDYGPLARREDPETEMGGWITLDVDIAGQAPETRRLLAHASGKIDFQAAPENIDTGVFDLWAVSLLSFIVPRLDPGPRSTLNCVVARFDLDDGIMKQKALLLDTTGMVARGDAKVDFREERFRALLTPRPKQAEALSLQTQVEAKGEFQDFQIGIPAEEVLATVVRFVTSVVVAPLQRIFGKPLPKDGKATCLKAWQTGRE